MLQQSNDLESELICVSTCHFVKILSSVSSFQKRYIKKKKSDVMTKEACKGQFRVTKICKASHSGKYCVKDKSSYFHFP